MDHIEGSHVGDFEFEVKIQTNVESLTWEAVQTEASFRSTVTFVCFLSGAVTPAAATWNRRPKHYEGPAGLDTADIQMSQV